MQVVTFYSYKGGLGRTLLLSATARGLARRGLRVLAIDLDLEAPGLHQKLRPAAPVAPGRGLVDLLLRFQDGGDPPPDITDFCLPVTCENGTIYVLPAGDAPTAAYWGALRRISWERLYDEGEGDHFFAWLREALESAFSPDFLLIDARTGVTEMGAAAVGLLADSVIALTSLATESKEGVREVLRAALRARQASERPAPRMMLAASRITPALRADDEMLLTEQLQRYMNEETDPLTATLSIDRPAIIHHEEALLVEEGRALGGTELRVHSDYGRVLAWLTGENIQEAGALRSIIDQGSLRRAEAIEVQRGLVESYRESSQRDPTLLPELAVTVRNLASMLEDSGDLRAALTAIMESVEILERLSNEKPEEFRLAFARGLDSKAGLLLAMGDLSSARANLERSISLKRDLSRTDEDLDVAASLHALAGVLRTQGDLDSGRVYLEQALTIRAKVFGTEERLSVAASLHELAGVLRAQGDLDGAKKKLERALAIQAKVLGTEEHPDVAASLHSLAGVLQAQGDLDGARKELERSLAIKAKILGTEEHPDVAASLHALAGVLKAQGDLDGAKKKLERSLAIQTKVFGSEEHLDVAASLHALGGVLKAQGDLDGAKKKLERSLAIKAKVFGTEEHPDVAASLHALGDVLAAQGDIDGAIIQFERVLQIEHHIYRTKDHYSTCITEVNLAQLLVIQGNRERAVELLQHALAVFTRTFPPGHPLMQQTQQCLAKVTSVASPQEIPGQMAAPYVLHTLGACGTVLIQPARLQRIAFRVLLYARAMSLMPLLLRAGEAQGAPDLVVDAPEQLTLPDGTPARLAEDWPEMVRQLGELRQTFASDTLALLAVLPQRDSGIDVQALAQQGLQLPEPDDDDWQALFDEAMAVAHAPNLDELQAELPLWTHAARAMLQRRDGEDSVCLARTLVAALPEQRDTLLAAWADVLTDAQRALL